MKVNVYDFDKTIYKNDSCVDFIKYTLKKHFFLVSFSLIKSIPLAICYLFNKKVLRKLKESLLSFIPKINKIDSYVEKYWDEKEKLIKKWYLEIKNEDDVIVSANFSFIIKPICKRLGIKKVICTEFDTKTGKIIGLECRRQNKIVMFKQTYPNLEVNKSYSDSKNDIPLLELGNPGYVVKGEKIVEYNQDYFK